MTSLTRFLYPLPDFRRTWLSQLNWWESRRLAYNVVVGTTGLVTVGIVLLFQILPPHTPGPWFDWRPIVAYGVLANVCYSLGWVSERLMATWFKRDAPDAGPVLFRQGLIFSVGLTLLPIGLAAIGWVMRVIGALF